MLFLTVFRISLPLKNNGLKYQVNGQLDLNYSQSPPIKTTKHTCSVATPQAAFIIIVNKHNL